MNQGRNHRRTVLLLGVWVFLSCVSESVYGQTTTATILGTARDESGAVLPGTTVTVKNVDTAVSRTVTTGSEGRYRIPQLALGSYEVEAQLAGFQKEVRKGITLTLGREAVVDYVLKVGAVTESVSVTGEAPLIETTSSSVANLVDAKSIEMLPLNGRDLTQLATLQAGVLLMTGTSTSVTAGPSKQIAIAGARPNQSSYLLDGSDIMNNTGKGVSGMSGQFLGVDSVREFNVLTSNYSAEYGRAAGGIINVVTKSGTNSLDGSVFEYLRNDNLDARNFFDRTKPEFKRNQFGASGGGPIRKDKTFFFGSYEGFREVLGLTSIGFVPTAEAREGRLPAGTIDVDPRIKPVLAVYPLPNGRIFSDGTGEFVSARPQPIGEDYVLGRIDHNFSSSDSLFGRYTFDNSTKTLPYFGTGLPGFEIPLRLRAQHITLQETKVVSANLINVARLGGNRSHYSGKAYGDIPELRFYPDRPLGSVRVTGLSDIGLFRIQPFDNPITIIEYSDDINWTKGIHAIKAGFNGKRYLWGVLRDFRLNGDLVYSSLASLLQNTASNFAGLLPGTPDTRRHIRESMYGVYIQDNIRVRPNFTLNLGLRYEFITNPTEITGPRLAYIPRDWDETHPVDGIVTKNVFEKNPSLKNFSPRVGFAWDLFGNGKTSLRAGWALIHAQILPHDGIDLLNLTPPFYKVAFLTENVSYPPTPFVSAKIPLAPVGLDYFNRKTPSMMQFNLSIEREVLPATVLSVSYIGSRSYHLLVAVDPNTRIPEFFPDGRVFFPAANPLRNPNWGNFQFGEWAAQAFYNSLNVNVRKQWGHGFQINGNYTFSRNVDDHSLSFFAADFDAPRTRQNPYDRLGDRGLANMHLAHAFNLSYVVDLPFGSGQRYGSGAAGVAGKFLEGWQVQGILSGNSGPPLTVNLGSFDRSRSAGGFADRPDLRPGQSNNPVLGGPNRYYDPTAFVLQAPGFFGNLGRNTVIGPGRVTFDSSVIKNTSIREGLNLQFRAEFFNLLNRANFARPGSVVFTASGAVPATAGRITTTITTARQIQFALRLVF